MTGHRKLITPGSALLVIACFVGCLLLGLGVLGGLFVCSAGMAGAALQHVEGNKEEINDQINRLPAPRRRRARVALLLTVLGLAGYGAWIEYSADKAREDFEQQQPIPGATPLFPEEPMEPLDIPVDPQQQPTTPLLTP